MRAHFKENDYKLYSEQGVQQDDKLWVLLDGRKTQQWNDTMQIAKGALN